MRIRIFFLLSFILSIFGCSNTETTSNSEPVNSQREKVTITNKPQETVKTNENKATNSNLTKTDNNENSDCSNLQKKDFSIDKKQTFAIDFKPFEKSCFATFHDPQFTNPPLGSQYFIYRNGKEIFSFPDQFNGGNATCWITAVEFADVNDDELKDVIVVGKCGAKSEAYNENMVYLNTGEDFVTNVEANVEMLDFTKVSQIKKYVRKNQPMFTK